MKEILREYSKAIIAVIVATIIFGIYSGGKYIFKTFNNAKENNEFIDLNEFQYSTYISNTIKLGIFETPSLSKSNSSIIFRENIEEKNIDKLKKENTIYYKADDFIRAEGADIDEIRIIDIEYSTLDASEKRVPIKPKYFIDGKETTKNEVIKHVSEKDAKSVSDFEYFTFNKEGNYTISVRVNANGMYSTRVFSISIINLI